MSSDDASGALGADPVAALIQHASRNRLTSLSMSRLLTDAPMPRNFSQLQNCLTSLDLSRNGVCLDLTKLPEAIGGFESLIWLNLSYNQFSVIPENVFRLSHLTELSLSHNRLHTIHAEIENLVYLERLTLAYNDLETLPPNMADLPLLLELDVSHNRIAILPIEFARFQRLHRLNVRHNPLVLPPVALASRGTKAILKYLREAASRMRDSRSASSSKLFYQVNTMSSRDSVTTSTSKSSNSRLHGESSLLRQPVLPENEEVDIVVLYNNQPEITTVRPIENFTVGMKGRDHRESYGNLVPQMDVSRRRRTSRLHSLLPQGAIHDVNGLSPELQILTSALKQLDEARAGLVSLRDMVDMGQDRILNQTLMSENDDMKLVYTKAMELANIERLIGEQLLVESRTDFDHVVQQRTQASKDYKQAVAGALRRARHTLLFMENEGSSDLDPHQKANKTLCEKQSKVDRLLVELHMAIEDELKCTNRLKQISQMRKLLSDRWRNESNNSHRAISVFRCQLEESQTKIEQVEIIQAAIMGVDILQRFMDEKGIEVTQGPFMQKWLSEWSQLEKQLPPKVILRRFLLIHAFLLRQASSFFPELSAKQPHLFKRVLEYETYPYVRYRLSDCTDVFPLTNDGIVFVGVNPYGYRSLFRKMCISQEQRPRFLEAMTQLMRNHSGLVEFRGVCAESEDTVFIEECFVDAPTLKEYVQQNSVSNLEIRRMLTTFLKHLVHLHRQQLVIGFWISSNLRVCEFQHGETELVLTSLNLMEMVDPSFQVKELIALDAPESHVAGERMKTVAADLYYFGAVICETLSTGQTPPTYDCENHYVRVPPLSPIYNDSLLADALNLLLTVSTEYRLSGDVLLTHPYFGIPQDSNHLISEESNCSELMNSEKWLQEFSWKLMGQKADSRGMLLVEIDPRFDLLSQIVPVLENISDRDYLQQPLQFATVQEAQSSCFADPTAVLLDSLIQQFFIKSSESISWDSKSVLEPNPKLNPSRWSMFGKLLMKLALDGYSPIQYAPLSFYKALLGSQKIAQHMDAFRKGLLFFTSSMTSLPEMSLLNLMTLIHGGIHDDLNPKRLHSLIKVCKSLMDEQAETILQDHLETWMETLSQRQLRWFLLFCTLRMQLPMDWQTKQNTGVPPYLVQQVKVDCSQPFCCIFVYWRPVSLNENEALLTRGPVGHVFIPAYENYVDFERAMTRGLTQWLHNEGLFNLVSS